MGAASQARRTPEHFLPHQYAFLGEPGVEKAHAVLALVNTAPHFEDVESLQTISGVAHRQACRHGLVDLDTVVGAGVKRQELLRLLTGGRGAAMRAVCADAGVEPAPIAAATINVYTEKSFTL